jgi:hypothetical protein
VNSIIPQGYWDDIKNQRERIEAIGEELGVKHLDQWMQIRKQDIIDLGGGSVINK